ncbi:HlyD family secretion protein [Sphingomonas morindae]|uniref:HlyD family secretion protein n=1 Tax=Sphingomonas morindae TaxID=1541170 RepID=A0ABY4XEK4_9SPHN|nr:HlyD family secretion protein [Sphingomonas morindae]USI75176.1 HlyD family secretion protein [Sphingomonas morindae]
MTDSTVPVRAPSARRFAPKRALTLGAAAASLIACSAYGLHWWIIGRFMVETDNAYVRADTVTISARVGGTIVAVEVADNQHVRAGAVLARIEDRDYRLKLAQAEAAITAANAEMKAQRAHIAGIEAEAAQQQSVIAQGKATIASRAADARFNDLEYRRQTILVRQEVGSDQTLEAAAAAAQRSRAGAAEARAGLAASRALLPVLAMRRQAAMADLDKALGMVRQAQAARDAAQLDLARTVIRAPVDGQVGQRVARVGQYADIGTPLMAVVPMRPYVVANYKETQAERIRPGQPVSIRIDAFGGAALHGRVDGFAPATGAQFALLPPDNATGNFTKIVQRLPLRITLDPGQARAAGLRPGMSVETVVDTRSARP